MLEQSTKEDKWLNNFYRPVRIYFIFLPWATMMIFHQGSFKWTYNWILSRPFPPLSRKHALWFTKQAVGNEEQRCPVPVDPREGLLSDQCQIARLDTGAKNGGNPKPMFHTKSSNWVASFTNDCIQKNKAWLQCKIRNILPVFLWLPSCMVVSELY